jgi:hypothetical protein
VVVGNKVASLAIIKYGRISTSLLFPNPQLPDIFINMLVGFKVFDGRGR